MAIIPKELYDAGSGGGSGGVNTLPVGTVVTSATPLSAPQWLPCDGRVYLKATYPLLAPKLVEDGSIPAYTLPPPSSTPTATVASLAFSDDGVYIVGATNGSAEPVFVYKRSGDVLTKLSAPANLPAVAPSGLISISGDATYIAASFGNSSPYVEVYKRSGDTFPTKATVSTTATNVTTTAFSKDSTYLALLRNNAPFVEVHKRSGDVFTKLPDFSELPAISASGVAFSPDGTYLVVAALSSTTRNIFVYKRSGDVFTLLPDDISIPQPLTPVFSPDGNYMAIRSLTAPFVVVFRRNGDTFTRLESSMNAASNNSLVFVTNDTIVACSTSSGLVYFKVKGDGVVRLYKDNNIPRQPNTLAAYNGPAANFDNYLAVGSNVAPYLYLMRDGYTYDPATEFQVPLETQIDERLSTYIKAS